MAILQFVFTHKRLRYLIDSHLHILPPDRSAGLVRWVKNIFGYHPSDEDCSADQMVSELRECGVRAAFNFVFPLREDETESLNMFNREICGEYRCLIPFGSFHPANPDKMKIIDDCLVKMELAGIKVHPHVQGFNLFSPEFRPVFKILNELGRPLFVHTGFDRFYDRTTDIDYLKRVLEEFPGMPVILVHALIPDFDTAYELMKEYPQIYLDLTNVVSAVRWLTGPPGWLRPGRFEIPGLKDKLDYFYRLVEGFSGRIMFGTDHPAGMGSPAMIYEDFRSFKFPEEACRNILSGTAQSLLKKYCPPKYFEALE
ncbi:MAG: amidohydrolase family protein [Actinobacteria bacterium]|nr:amidohydrolase family protein [Actinomycetota bacterium]